MLFFKISQKLSRSAKACKFCMFSQIWFWKNIFESKFKNRQFCFSCFSIFPKNYWKLTRLPLETWNRYIKQMKNKSSCSFKCHLSVKLLNNSQLHISWSKHVFGHFATVAQLKFVGDSWRCSTYKKMYAPIVLNY